MARIFVTVGMGPWPFDRLISALAPLCAVHDVTAQIGTSTVRPPCPHSAFLGLDEVQEHLRAADIVITHAGNTVRLVQRLDKVPIAIARAADHGEMGNDHQVEYLREEERIGRVRAVWDTTTLVQAVAEHPAVAARLLAERPLPASVDREHLVAVMDSLCERLTR